MHHQNITPVKETKPSLGEISTEVTAQTTNRQESEPVILIIVPQDAQILPDAPKGSSYFVIGAQATLGIIGLGAGGLYIGPAQNCVVSDQCGVWLSDLVSKKVAIGIFTAGGIDFAGINAYFASNAIQAFAAYINKQKTRKAKIGKGSLVILYATSQNVQILLASLGTSTELWQTFLTMGGAVPGSLYGATNMIQYELPYWLSKAKHALAAMYRNVHDLFSPITEEERQFRLRMNHYAKEHTLFLQRLGNNWQEIVLNASSVNENQRVTPRDFLFSRRAAPQPKSFFTRALHRVGQVVGAGLAVNQTVPIAANTFNLIGKNLSSLPLQVLSAIFFSSSSFYGNLKLTISGVSGLVDNTWHLLSGQPIESLPFQLRPKTTAAVLGVAALASILSYAVIEMLFEKQFPQEDVGARKAFRYGAISAIDIYHLAGLMHFYHLILSALTRDQKEKFIFLIEKEVVRFQKMTLDDFIEFVESNAHKNELYGIKPFLRSVEENAEREPLLLTSNHGLAPNDLESKEPLLSLQKPASTSTDMEASSSNAMDEGRESLVSTQEAIVSSSDMEQSKESSSCGTWCTWFSWSKSNPETQHSTRMVNPPSRVFN